MVVLNQLVYELSARQKAGVEAGAGAWQAAGLGVSQLVWLDGGHGGAERRWPGPACLAALAGSGVRLEVRVTPWQVDNPARTQNAVEEEQFSGGLAERGADITRTLHFPGRPSLENHFKVIRTLLTHPLLLP